MHLPETSTSAEVEVRERADQNQEQRRDDENGLTRKIGFLTATASEDWTLVLDVCDHASATEANAKEAVRALRREFKYGEPAAQLAAARLWAIILRNSSDTFISKSTSCKFLDTLEDLLTSSCTFPVVRECVMDVLAAAAYTSPGSKKNTGFRGLWRRVKPLDKPEEGMPFDTEGTMFNHPTPIVPDTPPVSRTPPRRPRRPISPEEDMRRLFQECKIGVGNANLLSQALALATPEQPNDRIIEEFHKKCVDSQELISAQLSWASAVAELSRDQKERKRVRTRKISLNTFSSMDPDGNEIAPYLLPVLTREEELLADLLASNEQLLEVIKLCDGLKCVALDR